MQDLTGLFGDDNRTKIFQFDSIKEMRGFCVDKYNNSSSPRCLAYVRNVIYRDHHTALSEMWGYEPKWKRRKNECILQDLDRSEFAVGMDITAYTLNPLDWLFKPRIAEVMTDSELINLVYGIPNFQTTGFDPVKEFQILSYKKFISRGRSGELEKEIESGFMPAYGTF